MIVVDANLLLYAYNERSPFYDATRDWLERTLSSGQEFGIPMQAIMAFVRVSTNTRLPGPHSSVNDAMARIDSLLEVPAVTILHPGRLHWEIFRRLCLEGTAGGNLSTDAHFAALAMERNAVLCSADNDFARFSGLRWLNPLAEK